MMPRRSPFPEMTGEWKATFRGLSRVPRKRNEGPANRGPLVIMGLSNLPGLHAARAPAFRNLAASARSASQMVIGAAMNQVE